MDDNPHRRQLANLSGVDADLNEKTSDVPFVGFAMAARRTGTDFRKWMKVGMGHHVLAELGEDAPTHTSRRRSSVPERTYVAWWGPCPREKGAVKTWN